MRTFSIVYSVPGTCDCCQAALPVPPGGASAGTYKIELPEGQAATTVQIAAAVSLTLGAGSLVVRLRQKKGTNRQWALKPLYNKGAFGPPQTGKDFPDGEDFYIQTFSFEMPEFKPTISTWWAELKFVEVVWGTRPDQINRNLSHNASSLSVRLTRLD